MNRCHGISLIEILVVVGIVAILAAMLVPAITMVKGAAQASHCRNNQRQIGMATAAYSTDWDGVSAPSSIWINGPPVVFKSAIDVLDDYTSTGSSNANMAERKNIWVCINRAVKPIQPPCDYGGNQQVHVYWRPDSTNPGDVKVIKALAQIQRASETVAWTDVAQASGAGTSTGIIQWTETTSFDASGSANKPADTFGPWATAINSATPDSPSNGYVPRYRHSRDQSLNVLWADGHVTAASRYTLLYRNITQAY